MKKNYSIKIIRHENKTYEQTTYIKYGKKC